MTEATKAFDSNTKTQLSLAAALFFSPLVHHMLNNNTRDITDQDRDFIRGYIKFGYITLFLGIITIAAGIMDYLFALKILNVAYTISIFILIFLLVISIVSILSDISLLKGGDHSLQNYTIEGSKKDIILKYLPIYNIYLWYKSHSFDKPNRWIKESILLWTSFFMVSIGGSIILSSALLILIILRIAALMSDIDFINTQTKHRFNRIFFKNPEEIFGYISGCCAYLAKSFAHIFTTSSSYSLEEEVRKEKIEYGRIIDIQNNNLNIILEYILGMLLILGLVYVTKPDFSLWTYYTGLGLFLGRYLIMTIQLKHLPHLPIARELLLLIQTIILAIKKFFIRKH